MRLSRGALWSRVLIAVAVILLVVGSAVVVAGRLSSRAEADALEGKSLDALRLYDQAQLFNPLSSEILTRRGVLKLDAIRDPRGALDDFTRALALHGDYVGALYERARASDELGDQTAAAADRARAQALVPANVVIALRRAFIRGENAEKLRSTILVDYPTYALAWTYVGKAELDEGNAQEARQDFDEALGIDPFSVLALYNRAQADIKAHDLDAYNLDIKRVYATVPRNSDDFRGLGSMLYDRHDKVGALAAYARALQLDPTDYYARRTHAQILVELKQPEAALIDYDKLVAAYPEAPELFREQGMVLFSLGRYERALSDFSAAIEHGDTTAHYERCSTFMRLHQYSDAIADCSWMIAHDNCDCYSPDPREYRADAYTRLGDREAAYADLLDVAKTRGDAYLETLQMAADKRFGVAGAQTAAPGRDPYASAKLVAQSAPEANAGHTDAAIADLTKAIALDPGNVEAYSERCGIHFIVGNRPAAKKDCIIALKLYEARGATGYATNTQAFLKQIDSPVIDSSKDDLQAAHSFVQNAYADESKGDLNAAITDWTYALKAAPSQGMYYVFRGRDYKSQGNVQAAKVDAQKAVMMLQADSLHLADAQALLKSL
jgi:tetratricopeptide (TPR) repeat protein